MKNLDLAKLRKNIETRMSENVVECNVGAAAIAVMQGGQMAFEGYFGEQTQENGEKIGVNTMYRLASMSKPVTAAAIGILWDKNLLSLHDPIEKYIPCFKGLHIRNFDEKGEIADFGEVKTLPTIFHLLTHTSGIGSDEVANKTWAGFTEEELKTLESAMPAYAKAGAAFEPYTRQAYSGVEAFDILARIVEIVSGMNYEEFLRENLFTPCDMPDTTFMPTEEQWGRMVIMHNKVDGKNAVGPMIPGKVFGNVPTTHFSGGAGLTGTLHDYLHFAEMLLHKGEYNGRRVLSKEYVSLMSQARIPEAIMEGNQRWGLGVRVITDETYWILPVGTFGWSGAYGTHFWVDPANQITAVYMKNSHYDGGAGSRTSQELEADVTDALTDQL